MRPPNIYSHFLRLALAAALLFSAPTLRAQQNADVINKLISDFQGIENSWSDAINTHNQYELENVLNTSFVGISADGKVTNRDQQVAAMYISKNSPSILTQRVLTVSEYAGADGANIAIVSGTYILKTKDGHDVDDERGLFTHIYLHGRTTWTCIHSQRTIIINQLLPKTKLPATPKH